MGTTVRISEAEATRDFASVMKRVRAGDDVVLEEGGSDVAVISASRSVRFLSRTAGEILKLAEKLEQTEGLAVMDEKFAEDMRAVHEEMNRLPVISKWD